MLLPDKIHITPRYDGLPHSDFIIAVKVCSLVSANGDWKSYWNPTRTKYLNPTLAQQERQKDTKHAINYAQLGYGFFPFVLGSFGGIGDSEVLPPAFYRLWHFVKPSRMMTCVPRPDYPLLILLIDLNSMPGVLGIVLPASLLFLLRPLC